jgi:hypothetical protein
VDRNAARGSLQAAARGVVVGGSDQAGRIGETSASTHSARYDCRQQSNVADDGRHRHMIDQIQDKVAKGQFEFSRHAVDQAITRHISVQEIREALISGEIIEDYPDDKYGPTCLILGRTRVKRPLHIQCAHPSCPLVKIVTVYEPDSSQWIEFRIRKKHDEG